MARHKCDKETEIELIKNKIITMEKKVDDIHRHLVGNGRPGLLERVSNNETIIKVGYTIIGLFLAALTAYSAL